MSEQSNSFHLRDADPETAAQLLIDARATGLVLPQRGPYTTMVVARRSWEAVTDKNKGTLLLYELAADHGFSIRLFQGPRQRAHLAKSFATGQRIFEPAPFLEHGVLKSPEPVEKLLAGKTMPRGKLAELFSLSDTESLSSDDLAERRPLLVTRFPSAVLVERGERVPWELDLADQSVILCALSAKRLAQLQEEPSLAADLLEARHEQTIKGLLDLGSRGGALLKAFVRSAAADTIADAIRGRSGEALAVEGLNARVLSAAEVSRISAALDAQDDALVRERCAAAGAALGQPKLEMGYRAMRELYRGAASRGEAMLVAVE